MKRHRIALEIEPDTYDAISYLAELNGKSRSAVIREIFEPSADVFKALAERYRKIKAAEGVVRERMNAETRRYLEQADKAAADAVETLPMFPEDEGK